MGTCRSTPQNHLGFIAGNSHEPKRLDFSASLRRLRHSCVVTEEETRQVQSPARHRAGILLLTNAGLLSLGLAIPHLWKISPASPLLNVIAGLLLLRDHRRGVPLVLLTLVADLVAAFVRTSQELLALVALPAVFLAAVAVLLIGRAGRARIVAGTILFAFYAAGTIWVLTVFHIAWD
jgi:hypothetical protein